ncbi:MAG: hypothetical protein WCC65_11470 [Pseudonocardiaceae bacterium]
MTPFDLDEIETRDAQRRLMTLASAGQVKLVIHNHDQPQWKVLKHLAS